MFYYHIFGCKNNKKITFSDIQLEKNHIFRLLRLWANAPRREDEPGGGVEEGIVDL